MISPGTHQEVLGLNSVSVNFGSTQALSQVTLTVDPGQMLFVTGESGAGKSTLLGVMSGRITPSSGQRSHSLSKDSIVELQQHHPLVDYATVRDHVNLAWPSSGQGLPEYWSSFMDLAKFLVIDHQLDQQVSRLNGGSRQKLALILCLLCRPKLLLGDELTQSLDKKNAIRVFDLLQLYQREYGLTLVWASHNKDLIQLCPGQVAHLDKGKLRYLGNACLI